MNPEQRSNILLGVGGGIAIYKSLDLIRQLRAEGYEVRVVPTAAAVAFVTPLTFQAISGHPVRCDLFDPNAEAAMDHIELARWADMLLIAPATADLLARLSHGLADDLLTTAALATAAPLVVAPAMNHRMWAHPATQQNVTRLRERGAHLIGPAVGAQACGEWGPGRMCEPSEIVSEVLDLAKRARPSPLVGRHVLMTAGPTREAIDPVRFIGNRSSGRMGYAVATALIARGAEVTLVSGPCALKPPAGAALIAVESALEMHAAVMERAQQADIFVAAAAVADYRPAERAAQKIKKDRDALTVRLVKNPDILAEVAVLHEAPFTVGFAAETEALEHHALEKLRNKRIDMIAANTVGDARGGFESEENALTVFWPDGRADLPMMDKTRLADGLADLITERYHAARTI